MEKIVILALLSGVMCTPQSSLSTPVFNAYSPGGRVPSYRTVTPRLVGVKVRSTEVGSEETLVGEEGRNIRVTARPPFEFSRDGALLPQQYQSSPVSYAFVQQPGEPLPSPRRIRVNPPSSEGAYGQYAAAAAATTPYVGNPPLYAPSGVQYSRAVASGYPQQAPQRHVVYSQPAPTPSPYRQVVYAQAQEQQPGQAQQYYAANPRPKVVQVSSRPLKAQRPLKQELDEEEEQYPSDPNPQYNFAFDVKDDDFTNYQNRQESRDKGVTKGSYSVVDPDGYVRTVTYEASKTGGFKAKVTREPTDVKIKFPVPTPAPEEGGRGHPAQPQQYAVAGPQYSVATPRRYPHRLVAAQQTQSYPQ